MPRAARGSVEQRGSFMARSKLATLGVVAVGLILPAASGAVRPEAVAPTTSAVYTVGGLAVPGVDTGLVLGAGTSVTVTATGAVCVSGSSMCPGPDGTSAVDTTNTSYGGYPLPGAPAYGLIARAGDGPWVQVGSGPTTLTGPGDLVLAVNDDYLPDNTGSFAVTVTLSYAYFPGWGHGDVNHAHVGPPGLLDSCYPGHGFGDANHTHAGPPGQIDSAAPADHGIGNSNVNGNAKHDSEETASPAGGGPGNSQPHGKHDR
jgi:hypothetical protein